MIFCLHRITESAGVEGVGVVATMVAEAGAAARDERIRAGEEISVDELVADRDRLAAMILRAGGLLAVGKE